MSATLRADVVFACGGTGGHIYPALAIAGALRARRPEWTLRFVGREDGLEARVIPAAGYPFEGIAVGGLRGKGAAERLRGILLLPGAVLRSLALLRRARPRVVVGTGGYVSGPVLAAALLLRVPFLLQEQNRAFGATNRMLSRLAARVAVSFEETARGLSRAVVTGNPVRPEFTALLPAAPEPGRLRVLVFGGSQGSRRLNEAVVAALPLLRDLGDRIRLRHQTGPRDLDSVREGWRAAGFGAEAESRVTPYIERMAEEFAAADLVVCRSGASTVAELAAAGRPAVLVPFPFATGDHQRQNARALAERGAATLVEDAAMTGERLAGLLREFLAAPERLVKMAAQARLLGRPRAAEQIALLCEDLAERRADGGAR